MTSPQGDSIAATDDKDNAAFLGFPQLGSFWVQLVIVPPSARLLVPLRTANASTARA